jgi:hypothetical protein
MSSPFIFTQRVSSQPPELHPSPYLFQYHNAPRISPYIPSIPLDLSAPNTPNRPPRDLDDDRWDDDRWDEPRNEPRRRRPSWHAGTPAPALVAVPSGYGAYNAPLQNLGPPQDYHNRRRSFDGRLYQEPSTPAYYNPWSSSAGYPYPARSQIHPLLKGASRYPPIVFDLSSPSFNPLEIVGSRQFQPISPQVLAQTATDPPTTRLVITCDIVPQWPIYLDYNAATAAASGGYLNLATSPDLMPITLGDVLYAIHTSFQTQISHRDWARLTDNEETAVARAYTRRCRAFPSREQQLASQGVRRVDYLLKTFMFVGLVRAAGDDGFDNLKLLVSSR